MRKCAWFFMILCLAGTAAGGFKVKLIKSKKAEQFMTRTTIAGVTYAADLLIDGGDQKDFFYKELTPSNIIAVRLAVFNAGKTEAALQLDGIQLSGPDGKDCALVSPETVAQAVLQGLVVSNRPKKEGSPVGVGVSNRDPRYDRTDPRYDPRMDPSDPNYDPSDPRNRGNQGRYGGPLYRPSVDVILNPGGGQGGGGGDLSQYEKSLVEKDFSDKAHTAEPVLPSMNRDRFLYFSIEGKPAGAKSYTLRLPAGKGIPQEIILKF